MHLSILTPSREFCTEQVVSISLQGYYGTFVIKPRHTPFVAALTEGVVKIITETEEKEAAIMGGFIEVQNNRAVMLTDAAEWPHEIDCPRAREALERAKRRLEQEELEEELDRERALKALTRAEIRLKLGLMDNN